MCSRRWYAPVRPIVSFLEFVCSVLLLTSPVPHALSAFFCCMYFSVVLFYVLLLLLLCVRVYVCVSPRFHPVPFSLALLALFPFYL